MDDNRFWEVIAASRRGLNPERAVGNQSRQARGLEELLRALPPEDVLAFLQCFEGRLVESYRWDLWAAAYLIHGGCSDDAFDDFRSWLISMGREAYQAALADAESVGTLAALPGIEKASFERFQYVARRVYRDKTGLAPEVEVAYPQSPAGDEWREEAGELRRRFPRLWAMYGWEA